ncbi:MAG TPA: class I SAM-dependent methyltransferase, partial [Stellaceae bacterium]|nr:class I SAM-dependent methyltransferase [Stellaceae bacterium]
MTNTLEQEPLAGLLTELHRKARRELPHLAVSMLKLMAPRLIGRPVTAEDQSRIFQKAFISLGPDAGRFAYTTARLIGARTIVEFGMSFGISTLYLAAAVRDNGGGWVVTTELDAGKCRVAAGHFARAGLADVIKVRQGDGLETLRHGPEAIDMVLLDGWKERYLDVLRLLEPRLRRGGVVLADNIHM